MEKSIEEIDWAGESIKEETEETTSLLSKHEHSIQSSDSFGKPHRLWFFHNLRQYVLIEVVVFLYFLSLVTSVSITQYYLFDKIAAKYSGYNISGMHPCENTIHNTSDDIQTRIQKETTMMMLHLSIATAFPAILSTIFLGGLSDQYGRKLVLLIALSGSLLRAIVYVIVINLNLHINYLFIGNAIEGLTGSYGTCLMAMFSLIADITIPGKSRAIRITVLEAMLAISSTIALLIAGFWVPASGFFIPMSFATVLLVAAFIFTSACLPETLQPQNKVPFSLDIFKRCLHLYIKDTVDHRRWKLIICIVSFFLVISINLSQFSLTTVFLLNKPFCWLQTKINTYGAIRVMINWISILLFLKYCSHRMSERTPGILGCISNMASLVLMGLAVKDIFIYSSAAMGILSNVTTPVLRSLMSHQATAHEQGILFASVGVIELSCTALMGVASTLVYDFTLEFFSGLVFLCLAGLMCIVIIMLIVLNIGMNRQVGSSVVRTIIIKS